MNALQKLRQLVDEVQSSENPRDAQDAWSLIERLLSRMSVDQAEVQRVCSERDGAALDALVTKVENPEPAASPDTDQTYTVSNEVKSTALRAFRKRLKVMRLSDESSLRGRRLTSGKTSEIDAIMPPSEYPKEVWAALAIDGKITDTGRGFYALPETQPR